MAILNGKVLAEARGKKGWTQVELSEATRPKIDVSTISRIERGKPTRVRLNTLRQLAKALDLRPESLCVAPEAEREVMKIHIEAAARNALTLVARRYGIRRERIVEIAPLLFFIAAEECLQERQKRVTEMRSAEDALTGLSYSISHLPPYCPSDGGALESEEQSIEARDLFGQNVIEDGFFAPDYEGKRNPFVTFLRDSLARVSSSPEAAKSVRWAPGLWPSYEICTEEAGSIVGGDSKAARAIVCGAAALHDHDMPKGSPEQRAEWARAELDKWEHDLDDFAKWVETTTSTHERRAPDTEAAS
jgi:transcriptional regulator with XRE-family HTH domain